MNRLHSFFLVTAILTPLAVFAQTPPKLVIYEPFGPQSVADDAVRMVQPDLEAQLKGPVEIRHAAFHPGAGGTVIDFVRDLPSDGHSLAAVELETELTYELLHPADKETLEKLTPIALLTDSIALALGAPNTSPIHDWESLKAATKNRSLTVGHVGRSAGMVVELSWLETALGTHFSDRIEPGREGILNAMAQGQADLGLLAAPTLFSNPLAPLPPVRAILTFGPHRETRLPTVPTFAEISGNRNASVVGSVAVFGPPGLSEAQRRDLTALFLAVNKDPKVRRTEAAMDFSPSVSGPDTVRADIQRDLRETSADLKALRVKPDSEQALPRH